MVDARSQSPFFHELWGFDVQIGCRAVYRPNGTANFSKTGTTGAQLALMRVLRRAILTVSKYDFAVADRRSDDFG
jgi:hypothetical protein